MHQQLIQSIVEEIRARSGQNFLGKIFQLDPLSLALDLGIRGSFLFVSAEPSSPRLYLIERRVRDLEKQSIQLSQFGQVLTAELGGARLLTIEKDQKERIVRLTFRVEDELGRIHFRRLVAQLTGRAANLFILDELNRVIVTLRPSKGTGQNPGEFYLAPPHQQSDEGRESIIKFDASPSAAADGFFREFDRQREFNLLASTARGRLRQKTNQKRKLRNNLLQDLNGHGNPETHKRMGDLLLANLATATREGNKVQLTDYYSDTPHTIEIEVDENSTLQEAATTYFRKYAKAKRARDEIVNRMKDLDEEISLLEKREQQLEEIIGTGDQEILRSFEPSLKSEGTKRKISKPDRSTAGVRRYLSTDGYEILVGRAAKDNDNLTFRIAKPNDLWLHAGDYPGSHVVIRNPTRKEIPHRTIIEAAQLAGRFSQASEDAKVVIHYTQKKFLSKPKGAALGLVRMSSFRSITVEPKESIPRL